MRRAQRAAKSADSLRELLGIEGAAASTYFNSFTTMLSARGEAFACNWPGRHGRSAGDALNVALNYVYGLLVGEVTRAVLSCGLDPHAGFVHSSSRNKPALVLDLMEEFRPVLGDAVVLGAINNGELQIGMYTEVFGGFRLRDAARRALIAAFERRIQQEFEHPIFRYRVSWRRAIEVQARMVLGVLDGTQPSYSGIRVR